MRFIRMTVNNLKITDTGSQTFRVKLKVACVVRQSLSGQGPLGRWSLSCIRQHSTLSAVSWRSDLRGAANTQQLRGQNCCSRWISLVELSSDPSTDCSDDSWKGAFFPGSMNTALC